MLDINVIRDCVGIEDEKGKFGNLWFCRILMIVCLVFAIPFTLMGFSLQFAIFPAVLFWGIWVFLFFMTRRQLKLQKRVKELDYYLEKDVCKKKYVEPSYDGSLMDTYYLCFEKKGRKEMSFPLASMYYTPSYGDTKHGDEFYFLYINKKLINIFNLKHWPLDMSQFTENDGRYYPVK